MGLGFGQKTGWKMRLGPEAPAWAKFGLGMVSSSLSLPAPHPTLSPSTCKTLPAGLKNILVLENCVFKYLLTDLNPWG